jgi:methyl-accepting chemotaxis protein
MLWPFKNDAERNAKLAAVERTQAVIEFDPDGTILTSNDNFLRAMGYTMAEIEGQHHRIFMEPAERDKPAYAEFWSRLRAGESQTAQFKRIGKGGKEIWIEASYNPISNKSGKVVKVVKYAIDVTRQKNEFADLLGQVNAISRSQAVISFDLDGKILDANENFLKAMAYTLADVRGQHHRMFVEPGFANGAEYGRFWSRLNAGEFFSGQYKRIGRGGREIWIEASYNPILDLNGKPYKVVKFATDITENVERLDSLKTLIDVNFEELDGSIDQSNRMVQNAMLASSETSSNVQMLASASEELAASVSEIASSMANSRATADEASRQTQNAESATRRLVDAAASMGGIVGLIQSIAGQINLLALNATIESARAGEAGKGFAVVANEVKNLANQAAKATEQISREIDGVQAVSEDVVKALDAIRSSIATVQEHVSATAAAVEEQSAVTRDMSSNMQAASRSVGTVSESIGEISAAVTQADGAVAKTRKAAEVLAR